MRRQGEPEPGSAAEADAPIGIWARLWQAAPLLLIAAIGLAFYLSDYRDSLTPGAILRARASLDAFVSERPVAAATIYGLIYMALVVFSLPGGFVAAAAGGLFLGSLAGGALAAAGAVLGATLVFLAARTSLGGILERQAGPWIGRLARRMRGTGFSFVVLLRLAPVIPFWISNSVPAILGVSLWHYVAGTLVGMLPWTFGFALAGGAFDEVLRAAEAAEPGCAAAGTCSIDLAALAQGSFLIASAIGILALVPLAIHLRGER